MRYDSTRNPLLICMFLSSLSASAFAQSIPVLDNFENPQAISYEVASNHKSTNCELYINGFGDGTETSYHAIGGSLYEAWIKVNGVQQIERAHHEVLNVGGYFRFSEQSTESPQPILKELYIVGAPQTEEPYYYRVDFRYKWHNMDKDITRNVHNFAFFMDVRREDSAVYRLWLTNGPRDFTISEVFDHYPLTSWISVGPGMRSMRYLEGYSSSPIFNARRVCDFR